jgi:flagellin
LSSIYGKLSSGSRITKASDDAAGLSVADSLRAQRRMASVALRNVNDGISFIAIADGTLEQVSNVLTRISELANQAASGVYSSSQRNAINTEALALKAEIDRMNAVSTFNGNALIRNNSSVSTFTFQAGLDSSSSSRLSIVGVDVGTDSGLALDLPLSLATSADAASAITALNSALRVVSGYRGTFGAFEARLRSAANTLNVTAENFAAAESRIRDADVAQESAELTRLTILQQAGSAVLVQANQSPALALQLLG